jgi:transposase
MTGEHRNGIDGLQALCKRVLASDSFSGTVFVFRNRRGTAVKVLTYDGQGFWLAQKRLPEGRFPTGRMQGSRRSAITHLR